MSRGDRRDGRRRATRVVDGITLMDLGDGRFEPLSPMRAAWETEIRRMEGCTNFSELATYAAGSAVFVLAEFFNAVARPGDHQTFVCDDATLRRLLAEETASSGPGFKPPGA